MACRREVIAAAKCRVSENKKPVNPWIAAHCAEIHEFTGLLTNSESGLVTAAVLAAAVLRPDCAVSWSKALSALLATALLRSLFLGLFLLRLLFLSLLLFGLFLLRLLFLGLFLLRLLFRSFFLTALLLGLLLRSLLLGYTLLGGLPLRRAFFLARFFLSCHDSTPSGLWLEGKTRKKRVHVHPKRRTREKKRLLEQYYRHFGYFADNRKDSAIGCLY